MSLNRFFTRWYEWLEFEIIMRNIPKEAKLNINVVGVFNKSSASKLKNKVEFKKGTDCDVILSWANMQVFDYRFDLVNA